MSNLRIPGPTPIPPEVVEAGAAEMINHRGPEFAGMLARVTERVRTVYETSNEVLVLTASGTGGMEAAVANHVASGDQVLVVTVGVFGKRFVELTRVFGGEPTELPFDFGTAADPNRVEEALRANPGIRVLMLTHNETSTGVINHGLQAIAEIARRHGCLVIVDAISSLSSIPVKTDEWGLDVVISGSQKGWMTAPGLAFVSCSERAWERQSEVRTPRFYFDLQKARSYAENGQTPTTPAVNLFFQLDRALDMMFEEGMPAIYERHHRVAQMTRDGVRALGLDLFADEGTESDTVTAVKIPDGIDGGEFLAVARERFDTVFAGGQGPLGGQIFRFGHMGYVTPEHIQDGLRAIEETLGVLRG